MCILFFYFEFRLVKLNKSMRAVEDNHPNDAYSFIAKRIDRLELWNHILLLFIVLVALTDVYWLITHKPWQWLGM